MPGKIKVKILAGRNLPVMDRSGDTTDAYVEIKFGNTTYKTDVCRKSLNPQWNSEWYRFEVDDAELQDEPLQVRLMDHDTYSANDAIGKVYVNLNPLLLPGSPLAVKNIWTLEATMNSSSGSQGGSVMTGWIPVFDTMHGIRGEVNIIVKVELFSDCNKFRQSSCGVQFFYSPNIPHGYHAQVIHGFVEELVVNDDPEYKWIDKIRTPRASNEARQTLFFKLSGEVQRKIGLKALDLGGNAVIGYVQNFDLEGESGIVARGIGTAVTLVKLQDITSIIPLDSSNVEDLTCFGLQSKNPLDRSESDDSLPLLSHSPSHSPIPRSPINLRATTVGQKFPKYEKSSRHHGQNIRVTEYRASSLRARQFSLQNTTINNGSMRKTMGSSLSLAEDLISETSLKNMLALEDMRGEPVGNPFSRGLKNFRYLHQNILPKRVAAIKSKISDSFDDESDQDSNYSSTWSLAGSESNRSSITDIRHSIRRKKFTHKKNSNDGIAALLIRSVHSGFPLDSVMEDRETPAPSPVNFIDDTTVYSDNQTRINNDNSLGNIHVETSECQTKENFSENKRIIGKKKRNVSYTNDIMIPMISSSETDTSTSDDDDDDEPSESSTNYNILDETYSLIDPSSPDDRKYRNFERTIGISKTPGISNNSSSLPAATLNNTVDSFERNQAVDIVRDNDENLCSTSQRDCSLQSSTDYNILDDTSSLLEPSFNDDTKIPSDCQENSEKEIILDITDGTGLMSSGSLEKNEISMEQIDVKIESVKERNLPDLLSEQREKIENSMIKTNMEIESMEDINFSSILLSDCHSECSTDYNFLEDTQSLIDPSLHDHENVGMIFQRDNEDTESPEVPATSGVFLSSYLENNRESLEAREDVKSDSYSISKISSFDENFIPIAKEIMKDPNNAEAVDTVALILSTALEKIDKSLNKIEDVEKFPSEVLPFRSIENLDSSTDYNVLDDSYPLIENSSLLEENFNPILRSNLNNTNVPETTDIEELILSSSVKQIDESMKKIENTDRRPTEENFFPDSRLDVNLDSSTDYNVLEEISVNEDSSIDEENFNSIFQIIQNTNIPKIPVTSELVSSPKRINEVTEKIEDIESSSSEIFVIPLSETPQIYSENEGNNVDCSFRESSSSVPVSSPRAKLGHLKCLPKQEHFDSPEDLDFVTSTPVKTDDTPPDFSPNEKSPQSFDSKKWDFQPIAAIPKLDTIVFKTGTADKASTENTEKQICPLGVPFEKSTVAKDLKNTNELKITNDLKSTSMLSEELREIENSSRSLNEMVRDGETPVSSNSSTKRAQKKVERTDTVIYKGPARDRGKLINRPLNHDSIGKTTQTRSPSAIPIIVAPPPEEHATRLQVPVIQTTNINVQSTFSPDEMKTQHFGSIGSRKFPLDECAISEKFNRKYRQHCMLDLIKTIDAKMMTHHMHHERRDSTRSKQRKKRERMNASATPSPDSIHRTRSHKKRSRSRSPERQHVHARGQISTLSTHSFPMKNASSTNLPQDPTSCDSSYENLARSNDVCAQKDPNFVTKESTISHDHNDRSDVELSLETFTVPRVSVMNNNDVEIDEIVHDIVVKTKNSLLEPKDLEHPVFKSHSAGSLEYLHERSSFIANITNTSNTIDDLCVPRSKLTLRQNDEQQSSSPVPPSSVLPSSLGAKVANSTSTTTTTTTKTNNAVPNMHRRSSDSDLSITPKGNSLAGSDRSMGGHLRPSTAIVRTMNQDTMEMLEYPFITMQQYPPGFVLNIGGLVSARSVKLLERITNLEEPEGRDAWWTEIRMEVRSHARALACNVVLGYKEEISICDDVCVLNASGTAAVINLLNANQEQDNVILGRTIMTTSVESERDKVQVKSSNVKTEKNGDETILPAQQQTHAGGKLKRTSESNDHEIPYLPTLSACSLCHLPYSESSVPFRVDVSKCSICRRAKVPDVLFTTIELPENIPMTGRGVFLQATVCKCKRDLRGELNAKEISDCLPFLEYELHSLLLNKLKVKGMNAIFGLKVQVSVGERLVIGMAVGTAVYLTALPTPSVPKIASGNSWHNEEQLADIQKTLIETVKKNREFYRLKPIADVENGRSITTSDTDESDDDLPDLDLGIGTKDACVLEVDDVEDMDRINLLIDEKPPDDFHVVNTQSIPGLEDLEIVRNLQMFTQISRAKIPAGQFASMPSKYFARMLQTVLFKLRRMVPCALCDMQFKVALPEQDEIQLSVVGMALGLGEPTRFSKYKRKLVPNSTSKDPVKKTDEADLIFSLDEDQVDITTSTQETMNNQSNANSSPLTGLSSQKHRPRSPFRTRLHMQHRHKHVPLRERYGVDITPLSYLPGGKIERYLGNLNFFFIRESTSIRENGGLSGFTHSFVTEILAIVRAHITALGGNAMVAFFMTQCVLLHSPHKNQGQCLINVGGDVVTVSYYGDDKYQGNQNC